LVYYDIYWTKTPSVTPFGELECRINRVISLVGGYSGSRVATSSLQNGYDQYDALTAYSSHKVASLTLSASPYGGLKVAVFGPYAGLFVGAMPVGQARLSSPFSINTGLGRKNGVQILVGMDFGWTHVKHQ
jgi:hypothetical protein